MIVPAAEFKDNFSEYLAMISVEDILVTKDDKIIACISKPPKETEENKTKITQRKLGIAKGKFTYPKDIHAYDDEVLSMFGGEI